MSIVHGVKGLLIPGSLHEYLETYLLLLFSMSENPFFQTSEGPAFPGPSSASEPPYCLICRLLQICLFFSSFGFSLTLLVSSILFRLFFYTLLFYYLIPTPSSSSNFHRRKTHYNIRHTTARNLSLTKHIATEHKRHTVQE